MFANRTFSPSGHPPVAVDVNHARKEYYSHQTVDNLVAAGLVDFDVRRSKRRSKTEGVHHKDSSHRRQVAPQGLFQDPHRPSNTTGIPRVVTDRRSSTSTKLSSTTTRGQEQRNEMFNSKGTRRSERTFVGANCAACEEPLEHMLRGERVLQLTCGHVAHEACFYEYIKEFQAQTCPTCEKPLGLDTSRGGNLDFDNLNKLARSAQTPTPTQRDEESTPVPWETKTAQRQSDNTHRSAKHQPSREHLLPEKTHSHSLSSSERYDSYSGSPVESHRRQASNESEALPRDYGETLQTKSRRPDSIQSIQTSASGPRNTAQNPIPPPLVTVRSEFPTLTKSRHQQSLTCLVTVEVLEGRWHPRPDDIRAPPPVPSIISQEPYERSPMLQLPEYQKPVDSVHEDSALDEARDDLFRRVDDWHGLDCERFGKLLLHGTVRVGKDCNTWQELECFLFSEMLICVKEKRHPLKGNNPDGSGMRCTLKGSILIRKHLESVDTSPEDDVLTLALSVVELPAFHLRFRETDQLEAWRKCLNSIIKPEPPVPKYDEHHQRLFANELDDDFVCNPGRASMRSSGIGRSPRTAPSEFSIPRKGSQDLRLGTSSLHVPLDIVVAIPVSSSMQGLKMNLLRDSLRFMISSLGERDRLGIVSFGSAGGGVPLIGLTNKSWNGWNRALESIRPTAPKNMRSDVIEGANGAMDMLMQRKTINQLSHIILISDSATSDSNSVDFVVQRAEAARTPIHSFGLGLTHKPDSMVEMSTRTKASYTYVKDWMMLRECLAGCLGALQSTSHQNVKLRLRLPEGSPAKFVKITGALQVTKRATGRDAEASLGDLRFGDKRDILVQLAVQSDNFSTDAPPVDPWQSIISGLEAMGPLETESSSRRMSIEELPLLQADLVWCDLLRDGVQTQLPRPSLLAITMLPSSARNSLSARPGTPPIPPHPSIVQRRMELLTSDMLSRALGLVARGQHDRALHLLNETRSILKGLGKGGLPPLPSPPPSGSLPLTPRSIPPTPGLSWDGPPGSNTSSPLFPLPPNQRTPSPSQREVFKPFSTAAEIDKTTMTALDTELETSLEWLSHPAIFARDARKGVLQAIGTINSQRGFTFRTPAESLWANRIPGVRRLGERSREWREAGDESLLEE